MVLPSGNITLNENFEVIDPATAFPTKTYHLNVETGRCSGFIDGQKAMEQMVFKVLNTILFKHLIYSYRYGFESMVGEDELYVRGDLPRRIQEALLQDERIIAVQNFTLDFTEKDSVLVTFTAVTIFGDVNLLKEAVRLV